jgi:hypothetical protein
MAINISAKQISARPTVGGITSVLLTLLNSNLKGIFPAAAKKPNINKNNPGQPHKTTDARVATMDFDLLSIIYSPLEDHHHRVFLEEAAT